MQNASRITFLSIATGALLLAAPLAANAADLAGSWKGGGTVTFSSGASESARCRATFSPSGKSAYDVSATCATQSGTVSQTAFVRGSGSSYRGTFYNPEFDTSGKIAAQLVQIQVEDLGIDYIMRRNAEVAAVTLEDAKRVAKSLLSGGMLTIVVGRPVGVTSTGGRG